MGEQLFIEYYRGKDDDGIGLQQTDVSENFQFQCKCSKCIPSWEEEDRMKMRGDPDFVFINQIDASHYVESEKRSVLKRKVLKFLNEYGRLPWSIEIEEVIRKFEYLSLAEYIGYVPS